MKTIVIIMGIIISVQANIAAQNYMGMSQARILKDNGEPDRTGKNFIVYSDMSENGENIYYFDSNGNCSSFEISRNASYLKQYQRILKSEFEEVGNNLYTKKTRKIHYVAELVLNEGSFHIKINNASEPASISGNNIIAGR